MASTPGDLGGGDGSSVDPIPEPPSADISSVDSDNDPTSKGAPKMAHFPDTTAPDDAPSLKDTKAYDDATANPVDESADEDLEPAATPSAPRMSG